CSNILWNTYKLDGSTHDSAWGLKTYQDETRQFVPEHPDFLGARVRFTGHSLPPATAFPCCATQWPRSSLGREGWC
uniref:Uncharacterized protein n=1 Tax=Oncorhynchus kisutch TaxID=8019 RepID=A0A8C7K686_ONCKI